jgi:hypothetical protein
LRALHARLTNRKRLREGRCRRADAGRNTMHCPRLR